MVSCILYMYIFYIFSRAFGRFKLLKNQLVVTDIFNIDICVVMVQNLFKFLPAFSAAAGTCLAKTYAVPPTTAVENECFCDSVFKNGFDGKIGASQ